MDSSVVEIPLGATHRAFMMPLLDLSLDMVPLANPNEVATFVTEKRRREHLSGRYLLGLALKQWGCGDLSYLEIQRDEFRAPRLAYIQGVWQRTPLPSVSIGHSGGHAFVALAPAGVSIGIDGELLERRLATNAFDLMAKGDELAELKSLPQHAMRMWVKKEAVQKSMGLGMHLNPRDIQLSIESDNQIISIENSKIQLDYYEYNGYRIAVATTGQEHRPMNAEESLLEETKVAMEDNPDWGVGCKTNRNAL
jgi:phosphopantetheinyl transferase